MDYAELKQAERWIINSLLELLKKTEYSDITISQIVKKAGLGRRTFYRHFKSKDNVIERISQMLMDQFADTILINHADTLMSITQSYFEFWENNIDILLLMKKAHLLYFIEDNLMQFIQSVAIKAGHVTNDMSSEEIISEYKYDLEFKIAGYWKLTTLWCSEIPRKNPEEMAKIVVSIIDEGNLEIKD